MFFAKSLLLLGVVLPGLSLTAISAYFLFPEWAALTASHENYQRLAQSGTATVQELEIAQAAEMRHRINCFAEGVGVLGGWMIVAIGLHGLTQTDRSREP
ncbi:MAG: hypothetical protein ACLFV6_14785 [Spirulinaceae cyanobacterium]